LLGIFITCVAVLYPLWRFRGFVAPKFAPAPFTKADWLLIPSLALIAWSLFTVTWLALKYPLIEWDAVSTWGYKAKVLTSAAIPHLDDYFRDQSLGFSHLDYPLLLPFLTAGYFAALGAVDDTLEKLNVLFLFWCYALFVYAVVRPLLPRAAAAAVAAIAVSAPMVLRWAGQGTADMPLAIFYAASILYLVRWIMSGASSDAWLAALFSAACLFTKNEGLALAVINLVAAAAFGSFARPRAQFLREFAWPALAAFLLLLPWIIFRHSLPHIDENYPAHLNPSTILGNLNRLPYLLGRFYAWMFNDPDSNFVWPLALGALCVGLVTRPSAAALVLLFLLLAQLAAYLLAYTISPLPLEDLVFVTLKRLLLHALPAGIFIIAFSFSKFLPPAEARPTETAKIKTPAKAAR
jgi:hypothetical protein